MPQVATPGRRRIAMTVLLALAVLGAVIRAFAPNPSVLRDVGTLLLVLWLPAVGNLIAWLVRQWPRKPAPAADFDPAAPFTQHLRVELTPVPVTATGLDGDATRCTLILGQQGFTARLPAPIAQVLAAPAASPVAIELLRPDTAREHLVPGAVFHLLLGVTAVAKGRVLA